MVGMLIATDAVDMALGEQFSADSTRFTVLFSAVAMGMQNVCTMREKAIQQNTTIFTGNLQKLGELFHRILSRATKKDDPQVGAQLGFSLCVYILGAAIGACAVQKMGHWSLWPAAVVQTAAVLGLA